MSRGGTARHIKMRPDSVTGVKHKGFTAGNIATGTKIGRREDQSVFIDNAVLAERLRHEFELNIDNENFIKEKHKEKLINMLVDLYYEVTLDPSAPKAELEKILGNVKNIVETDHTHDWDYVDRGNYIDHDEYLFRFVCTKCGDYRRIEQKTLREGVNLVIDGSPDNEPVKLIPTSDGEQSAVERVKPASVYD